MSGERYVLSLVSMWSVREYSGRGLRVWAPCWGKSKFRVEPNRNISVGVVSFLLLSSSDGAPGLGPGSHVPRGPASGDRSPAISRPLRDRVSWVLHCSWPPHRVTSAGPRWWGMEQRRGRGVPPIAQTLRPLLGGLRRLFCLRYKLGTQGESL